MSSAFVPKYKNGKPMVFCGLNKNGFPIWKSRK